MRVHNKDLWLVGGFLFILLLGVLAIVLVTSGAKGKDVQTQSKLDTLYMLMVGEEDSIQKDVQDLTQTLNELCHVVAEAKNLDPRNCDA